jgi:hypothetical protein
LDVVSRKEYEARRQSPGQARGAPTARPSPLAATQPAARPSPPAARPSPPAGYVPPAPKSMVAIGGRPGTDPAIQGYDPTFAPHEGSAVRWQVNVLTMLNEIAAKIDAQERRADEQERRIKAMEAAAADRKARAGEIAAGIFGTLQLMFAGR